jgi:hypothetical protein
LLTDQVSITAIVYSQEEADAYINSLTNSWIVNDNGTTRFNSEEMTDTLPVTLTRAQVEETEGICYKVSEKKTLAVQIALTDEDYKLKSVYYQSIVPVSANEGGTLVLPEDSFDTGKVLVRFMEIKSGGVAEWSDCYELAEDGSLTIYENEESEIDEADQADEADEAELSNWQQELLDIRASEEAAYLENQEDTESTEDTNSSEDTETTQDTESTQEDPMDYIPDDWDEDIDW